MSYGKETFRAGSPRLTGTARLVQYRTRAQARFAILHYISPSTIAPVDTSAKPDDQEAQCAVSSTRMRGLGRTVLRT